MFIVYFVIFKLKVLLVMAMEPSNNYVKTIVVMSETVGEHFPTYSWKATEKSRYFVL